MWRMAFVCQQQLVSLADREFSIPLLYNMRVICWALIRIIAYVYICAAGTYIIALHEF